MARKLRLQVAGGAYHVVTRGATRQPIFRDVADREIFLALLAAAVNRLGWACHAYCLMTTHYHLLIRTPNPDLAVGMHRLNGHYAQGFNRRHAGVGHVFESRYWSVLVERDAHLLELSRYLPRNPVRAGICNVPEAWPWSSCGATLGVAPRPPFLTVEWLLAHFGSDVDQARKRFREFVNDASGDTLSSRGLTP